MATWDYDGSSNLQAGSDELADVLANLYNRDVRRLVLKLNRDKKELEQACRKLNARTQLWTACAALRKELRPDAIVDPIDGNSGAGRELREPCVDNSKYPRKEDTLIIVHYRGHGSEHEWQMSVNSTGEKKKPLLDVFREPRWIRSFICDVSLA